MNEWHSHSLELSLQVISQNVLICTVQMSFSKPSNLDLDCGVGRALIT
jgi:hypothetical protein